MKVAVLGKGGVGRTLGNRFAEVGHEVRFGIRSPQSDDYMPMVSAVAWSDLVVMAVPFPAAQEVLASVGDLGGRTLVDVTNAIKPTFDGLAPLPDSAGERVAEWAVNARVVKAFNTIGVEVMAHPTFGGRPATLLMASDDDAAKSQVAELAQCIGFDPVDAGGIRMSHYLEAFAWVWINHAVRQGMRHRFVFQLIADTG